MKRLHFSLSFLLPAIALLAAWTLIAVPTTLAYLNLRQISQHGRGVTFHTHTRYLFTIPRSEFLRYAFLGVARRYSHTIQATDIPAFIPELAIDRCSKTWPGGWTPPGIDFLAWRAMIWPVYCLPFWWFVGTGFDTLTRRRQMRWWWLLLGTLLFCSFLLLTLGMEFGLSAAEHRELVYPLWGFGLWAALFGVFPTVWIVQFVRRRRGPLHQPG